MVTSPGDGGSRRSTAEATEIPSCQFLALSGPRGVPTPASGGAGDRRQRRHHPRQLASADGPRSRVGVGAQHDLARQPGRPSSVGRTQSGLVRAGPRRARGARTGGKGRLPTDRRAGRPDGRAAGPSLRRSRRREFRTPRWTSSWSTARCASGAPRRRSPS